MLRVETIDDKTHVWINYSSLDIVQTCVRKAELSLFRNLRSSNEAPALVFGKGTHKAMEVWYSSPRSDRKRESTQCDDSQALMLSNATPIPHGNCARCSSIFAFLKTTNDLAGITDGEARSRTNGIEILNHYFNTYLEDPYDLLVDDLGPLCERTLETIIFDSPILTIHLFGTVDAVFRNTETNEIVLADHKTTHQLGKDFFNRIKPNFQYTGYWLLARQELKLDPSRFMVNGIQVAKTKKAVERQFTTISEEEISDLITAILYNVENYLKAIQTDTWPMSAPNACSMWGGCSFKRICELPRSLQKSVISAEYGER